MAIQKKPAAKKSKMPSELLERFKSKAATSKGKSKPSGEKKEESKISKLKLKFATSKAEPKMTPAERKAKARDARRKALKDKPKKKTRLERAELGKKLVSKTGPRPSDPKKKKQSSIAKAEAAGMAARKAEAKKKKTRGSADTKNTVSKTGPRPRPKPSVTTGMTPAERKDKKREARLAALKARPKKKTSRPPKGAHAPFEMYVCNGKKQGTPCKKSTGGSASASTTKPRPQKPKSSDPKKKTKGLTVAEKRKLSYESGKERRLY